MLTLWFFNIFYLAQLVSTACPPDKILYDAVVGLPDASDQDPIAKAWQPLLNYHDDSCNSYPAVNAAGSFFFQFMTNYQVRSVRVTMPSINGGEITIVSHRPARHIVSIFLVVRSVLTLSSKI